MVNLFQSSKSFKRFGIDLAADDANTKCATYITEEEDSLVQPWAALTSPTFPGWCNPPYAKVRFWVEKGHNEAMEGATVFMLIPISLHRNYAEKYLRNGPCSIILLSPAIKFDGYDHASSVMHKLVIFNKKLSGKVYWGNMKNESAFAAIVDEIYGEISG